MKILFLTTVLPGKRTMGSEVASQAVIDAMTALGADVLTLGYVRPGSEGTLRANEVPAEVRVIESHAAGWKALSWLGRAIFADMPYTAAKYHSRSYVTRVRELVERESFDVVVLDHAQLTWLLNLLPAQSRVLALVHNVEHEMYRALAEDPERHAWWRWVYRREAQQIERCERLLAQRADEIWALTEHDAAFFSDTGFAGKVRVLDLPGGDGTSPPLVRKIYDIALIGSWAWRANRDGLDWFLEHVYPLLPADVSIQVAGKGADWLAGRYANIDYRGFVSDAQEFLAQARVVAIPTLSGGGIQIKTLDAIASGSRLVATPVALRGIGKAPSTVVLASEPVRFARALCAALEARQDGSFVHAVTTWSLERKRNFLLAVQAGMHGHHLASASRGHPSAVR